MRTSSVIYNHPSDLTVDEVTILVKTATIDDWLYKPKYFYALCSAHGLQRLYFEKSRDFLKQRKYSFYTMVILFEEVYLDFLEEFSFTCYVPCYNVTINDSNKKHWENQLKKNFPKCNFIHIID